MAHQSANKKEKMARYILHVPTIDEDGNKIPHVLSSLRSLLNHSGFHGRTVMEVMADLNSHSEPLAMVAIDALDSPDTDEQMKLLASQAKLLSGQHAVYLVKHPIEAFLV